ncbi:hypothetical protein ACROYT_G014316 [Oculina patagonica]
MQIMRWPLQARPGEVMGDISTAKARPGSKNGTKAHSYLLFALPSAKGSSGMSQFSISVPWSEQELKLCNQNHTPQTPPRPNRHRHSHVARHLCKETPSAFTLPPELWLFLQNLDRQLEHLTSVVDEMRSTLASGLTQKVRSIVKKCYPAPPCADKDHTFADPNEYKISDEPIEEGYATINEDFAIPSDLQGQRVSTPRQEPKDTERQIKQQAMVYRETTKEITSLTNNIENSSALKKLNSSLEMLRLHFSAYEMIDERENLPNQLSDKKIGKRNRTSTIGSRYLALPVRPKRNKYKISVRAFASMMQNITEFKFL